MGLLGVAQGWCPMCGRFMGGWMGGVTLVWIIVILLVFWMLLSLFRRGGDLPDDTPEDTLRHRYARGEIDRATYEQMLAQLRRTERRP